MLTIKFRVSTNVTLVGLVLGFVVATLLPASAAFAASGAIAQSYTTHDGGVSPGALVSFSTSSADEVVLASRSNALALAGVATDQPLVELSSGGSNGVQVAVGGTAEALVSDANGPIKVGDRITASPVAGIGMKATAAGQVVGIAQANLSSVQTVTRSFVDTTGKQIDVHVGRLAIAVNAAYYAGSTSQGVLASFVPSFLQSIANTLTGKQVSPLRVLLGTMVLIFGFAAVMVMLYVSVKSGVISIGRNPLAQQALRRGLIDVIIAAFGVLLISGVVVYVILFG